MRTTASDTRLHRALLNERCESREHVGIGLREDAVPEVEDVRASLALREHVQRRAFDQIPWSQQRRGVEVALDGTVFGHGAEGQSPVDADDVAACTRKSGEKLLRRPRSEMDRRR